MIRFNLVSNTGTSMRYTSDNEALSIAFLINHEGRAMVFICSPAMDSAIADYLCEALNGARRAGVKVPQKLRYYRDGDMLDEEFNRKLGDEDIVEAICEELLITPEGWNGMPKHMQHRAQFDFVSGPPR